MSPPPNALSGNRDEIPKASFAEVPVSAFGLAEEALAKVAIVPLEDYGSDTYKVGYLKCRSPGRLYLLRAVYGNPSTGSFGLYRVGRQLIVMHQYLGAGVAARRSALVACLDFKPEQTFVTLGGGM